MDSWALNDGDLLIIAETPGQLELRTNKQTIVVYIEDKWTALGKEKFTSIYILDYQQNNCNWDEFTQHIAQYLAAGGEFIFKGCHSTSKPIPYRQELKRAGFEVKCEITCFTQAVKKAGLETPPAESPHSKNLCL